MEIYSHSHEPIKTTVIDAQDTDEPLIWFEYRGPFKFAKVKAATTTGDLEFWADDTDGATTKACGSGTAFDMTATGYNTWGQVADKVNNYNHLGWYAWLDAALRADETEAGAGATTIIPRNTAVSCWRTPVALYHDTSALMSLVSGAVYMVTMGLTNKVGAGSSNAGRSIEITGIDFTLTEATKDGTINKIRVFECDDTAETEVQIYQVNGGATAVLVNVGMDDFGNTPLVGRPGTRLVVRETNDVALTAPLCVVRWRSVPVRPPGSTSFSEESRR